MKPAIYIAVFIMLAVTIALILRGTDTVNMSSEKQKSAESGSDKKDKNKKDKKDEKDKNEDAGTEESANFVIHQKWEVPEILKEISALTYVDKYRFACVQDELGKIFIYNTNTKKIEKEIPFGGSGDYEGVAIAGQNAYILRADGQIFQVKNYNSANPQTIQHKTHLTAKNDPEGMCYDSKNNRLLIAIKGSEQESDEYKGIYSFSLTTFKMEKEPAYKIDLNHPVFENIKGKKSGTAMQPSAIAIHPKTGDIYITEATKPKLLIMDSSGNIKSLQKLNSSDFNQPEGIIFSPDARLFVSNEGTKEPGNILEIQGTEL